MKAAKKRNAKPAARIAAAFALVAFAGPWAEAREGELDRMVVDTGAACARGAAPGYFVFDLDETLVDSRLRRYLSYRDAAEIACAANPAPAECAKARQLRYEDGLSLRNAYSHIELMGRLGIDVGSAFAKAWESAMVATYLSGKYMEFDTPVPGADAFIRDLVDSCGRGVPIYYVTARYADTQLAGTLASLRKLGFLDGVPDAGVVLRVRGEDSLAFKERAFREIRAKEGATARGVFENEPENLNAMVRAFPEAQAIFVLGAFMKDEPLSSRARKIRSYR